MTRKLGPGDFRTSMTKMTVAPDQAAGRVQRPALTAASIFTSIAPAGAVVIGAAAPLAAGTLCCLLGGGVVRAYRDITIGDPWDGFYRVQPADDDAATWRGGVPRDQLTPLTDEGRREYLRARAARAVRS